MPLKPLLHTAARAHLVLAVAARDAARCRWSRLHEYLQSLHSAIRALFEPRELQPEFPLAHVRRVELYTSRRPRFPAKFIESPPRDRACCSGGRRTATGLFSASNVAMESPPKLSRFFRAGAAGPVGDFAIAKAWAARAATRASGAAGGFDGLTFVVLRWRAED